MSTSTQGLLKITIIIAVTIFTENTSLLEKLSSVIPDAEKVFTASKK